MFTGKLRTAALASILALGASTAVYADGPGWVSSGAEHEASTIGFQDGINDGTHDRLTGHSFRPTKDDNYKHTDRGYASADGKKEAYREVYREAYVRGYRKGYEDRKHFWER